MKVGLFDHVERSDRPLAQIFDERLQFLAAADEAGFYCAHVAEHHCTPLNMVPAPSVYLGAIARLTKRRLTWDDMFLDVSEGRKRGGFRI